MAYVTPSGSWGGDIHRITSVYEPFMGSGATLIAAETTGRVCYGLELNPVYVNVAVERWQQFTGQSAVLDGTGQTFADLTANPR